MQGPETELESGNDRSSQGDEQQRLDLDELHTLLHTPAAVR